MYASTFNQCLILDSNLSDLLRVLLEFSDGQSTRGGGDWRWYIFGQSPRWEMGEGENVTPPRWRWEMVIVDEKIGEMGDDTFLANLAGG